mgnify:CR=1 FL=1
MPAVPHRLLDGFLLTVAVSGRLRCALHPPASLPQGPNQKEELHWVGTATGCPH